MSRKVINLTKIIEIILSLVYPFIWILTYIPYLPKNLIDNIDNIIEAPLPFIICLSRDFDLNIKNIKDNNIILIK